MFISYVAHRASSINTPVDTKPRKKLQTTYNRKRLFFKGLEPASTGEEFLRRILRDS
jgi:hypothetical protein